MSLLVAYYIVGVVGGLGACLAILAWMRRQ